ncbi:hypothetical protein DFH07DRAFT_1031931 [Mycena maculata]|uniref:2-oxoacid dehydrogenase acyltransferase catalytic domain-containing protein n=1 Tax=Mycena maculata TaxID=230809 RepID=A0AAD7N9C4_9AGAR|nr:hypothetical protein DFH07DRAFT_1031931 [Mycena maculata]
MFATPPPRPILPTSFRRHCLQTLRFLSPPHPSPSTVAPILPAGTTPSTVASCPPASFCTLRVPILRSFIILRPFSVPRSPTSFPPVFPFVSLPHCQYCMSSPTPLPTSLLSPHSFRISDFHPPHLIFRRVSLYPVPLVLLAALGHSSSPSPSSPSSPSITGSANAKPTVTICQYADIALALMTPMGFYTPILPAVESHSVSAPPAAIAFLTSRGRAVPSALRQSDYKGTGGRWGGTVSVRNVGAAGAGTGAVLILVEGGGVAILGGMGGMRGAGRLHLLVSWAADHRVVEGADLAAPSASAQSASSPYTPESIPNASVSEIVTENMDVQHVHQEEDDAVTERARTTRE